MPVAISGLIQLRKDFCGLISGGAFLRGGGGGGGYERHKIRNELI